MYIQALVYSSVYSSVGVFEYIFKRWCVRVYIQALVCSSDFVEVQFGDRSDILVI